MIFDHIVLAVANQNKSREFYLRALTPLGILFVRYDAECSGFGTNNKPSFWICEESTIQKPMHIAFIADNKKSVDAFYEAAIIAGGKDNGAPGFRNHYSKNYYSAYIIDPDGHNIEAVCREGDE